MWFSVFRRIQNNTFKGSIIFASFWTISELSPNCWKWIFWNCLNMIFINICMLLHVIFCNWKNLENHFQTDVNFSGLLVKFLNFIKTFEKWFFETAQRRFLSMRACFWMQYSPFGRIWKITFKERKICASFWPISGLSENCWKMFF